LAGAVERARPTVAVLGSGIDTAYPPSSRGLVGAIATRGTVVSEYPPGTPAEPFRFPARNRLVAALSRAVVVVEGAPGSGSLITAEHALDLGREVFAVPGPVFSELAAAPLELIRDGATLIRGPDDLLGDIGLLATPGEDTGAPSVPGEDDPRIPTEARSVWRALAAQASADEVATALGLPPSEVLPILVALEVAGLITRSGGRFRRVIMPAGR
jgi:DNA processing protein